MAIIEEVVNRDFSIGDTLGKIINIFFSKFIPLNLLVLITQGPLILWAIFGDMEAVSYLGENPLVSISWSLISVTDILAVILFYATASAVTYGVFQELTGRKIRVGDCLSKGIALAVPTIFNGIILFVLFIISAVILGGAGGLLFSISGWLGAIIFVILGVYMILIFLVVLPVVVVENPGAFASLGRSVELTKNNRLALLGLLIISSLILAAFDWVFEIIPTSVVLLDIGFAATIMVYAYQVLKTTIGIVFITVIYNNLRVSKEDVSPNQIASVFD